MISVDLMLNTSFANRAYTYVQSNAPNSTLNGVTNQNVGYALLMVVVVLLVPFAAWLLFNRLPTQVRRRT